MSIQKLTLKRHEGLENWFVLTFLIRNAVVGTTIIEMVCSEEMLRAMFLGLQNALGEKPDYSNLPENLQKFMKDK